jgi:hypothetical protein
MNPDPTKTVIIDPDTSIEIGESTWNPAETSIRRRYQPGGKFSPHGSSEIPIDDLKIIMEAAARHDELDPKTCAAIITALADSIHRQLP